MKSYKEWLNEALKLSQYRRQYKIVKSHYLDKYDDWFGKEKRIYLPLNGNESDSTYQLVNSKLSSKGYEISSWKDGIASKKDSNRVIRIGKLLADDNETLKKFNERFKGKNVSEEKEYEVVISRHLYDIAAQSTDRQWSSCKNLVDGENAYFIPAEFEYGGLIAYVIETQGEINKTEDWNLEWEDNEVVKVYMKNFPDHKSGKYLVKYLEDGISLDDKYIGGTKRRQFIKALSFVEDTPPTKLVKGTHKNLNDPIARLLIVPYFNVNDPNNTFLYVPDRPYGKMVTGFRETVQAWLDKKQGKKTGIYCRTKVGYDDKYPAKINKDTGEEDMHDNPTFNVLRLGSIDFWVNGETTDYSPDRIKRFVVNKGDEYPLSSFMEEVYIDEQTLIQSAIAGVNSLKQFFLDTLSVLLDNWDGEEEGPERDRYINYYKKLFRMINRGDMSIRFTLE